MELGKGYEEQTCFLKTSYKRQAVSEMCIQIDLFFLLQENDIKQN